MQIKANRCAGQPVDGRPALSAPGRRLHLRSALLLLAASAVLLSGCYRWVPYPDTVYVPHPDKVDKNLTEEELREMYTTSPNLDPDGWGYLQSFGAFSQFTLELWEMSLEREELNRSAYARTENEQRKAIWEIERYHGDYIAFTGLIKSDGPKTADARWYQPEGIYLIDDIGQKFLPVYVSNGEVVVTEFYYYYYSEYYSISDYEKTWTRFPEIRFHREAITAETRAITLYFAALQKRLSMTWIFDPTYKPESVGERREYGTGLKRMFRGK